MPRTDVMGVMLDNLTMQQFAARAQALLEHGSGARAVTPNAEIIWQAMHDPAYRQILNGSELVLPDGAGVLLGARILGTPLREKVPGVEFGEQICAMLAKTGGRLYLLGGRPGVAEQAGQKLQKKYPGLRICGTADGYFADEAEAVRRIARARPDAVFVCLGVPKQERFMQDFGVQTGAKLLLGLGGSLDVYAGRVRRAPKWMIRCNLEWLYRLLREPSRLGRALCLPKFVICCLLEQRRRKRKYG